MSSSSSVLFASCFKWIGTSLNKSGVKSTFPDEMASLGNSTVFSSFGLRATDEFFFGISAAKLFKLTALCVRGIGESGFGFYYWLTGRGFISGITKKS